MKKLLLIFMCLGAFVSCSQDKELSEENISKTSEQLDDRAIIQRLGFDVSTIVDKGDYYLVEGDIGLKKENLKQHLIEFEQQSDGSPTLKQGIVTGRLVSVANAKNITIRIDASVPTSGTGSDWRNAVMTAINAWNNIQESCVRFTYTTASSANITVKRTYDSGGAYAWTWLPSNQKPPTEIFVNSMHDNFTYKANTVIHEMGHTLGLLHAHATPSSQGGVTVSGTPEIDDASIMSYNRNRALLPGFSNYDLAAIRRHYPLVDDFVKMSINTSSISFYLNFHEDTDFKINWGDGQTQTYTLKKDTWSSFSHYYSKSAQYNITLNGPTSTLKGLNLHRTWINTLDISKSVGLHWLRVAYTNLSTVNLSKNVEFTDLYAGESSITQLNFSNNPNLKTVILHSSPIINNSSALNSMINSMPYKASGMPRGQIFLTNQTVLNSIKSLANSRNWDVINQYYQ